MKKCPTEGKYTFVQLTRLALIVESPSLRFLRQSGDVAYLSRVLPQLVLVVNKKMVVVE